MTPGLRILSLGGGRYPYVVVGWFRCRQGDEWEGHGVRVIRRFGQEMALAQLACRGGQT